MFWRKPHPGVLTPDDVLQLPETGEARTELVEGRLVEMSPTSWEHDNIAWRFNQALSVYLYDHPELGECSLSQAGYRIRRGDDTPLYVPDFAFTRAERLPPPGDPGQRDFLPAPDLVLEVISPGDGPKKVKEHIEGWLANGVQLLFVVYPEQRRVYVYHAGKSEPQVLSMHDTISGEEIVPGWRCPVRRLFR